MAVVVLPRISIPAAYSSFSCRRNNAQQHNKSNVAFTLTQSCEASSPILSTRPKAIPVLTEMVSTITEKDDGEIKADVNRIQHACERLKGFLRDTILLLMAANPIFPLLSDVIVSNNNSFIRWSSVGASYGALVVLKECVKFVWWKSQPIWAFIIMGYLIYKTNRRNIVLHRKGQYPIWIGIPLHALFVGKWLADCFLLLSNLNAAPLKITLGCIDTAASFFMFLCFICVHCMVENGFCSCFNKQKMVF